MIGMGFGVITSQGASSARQSRPASSSRTRLAGSSESLAATAAPAEPPPTTMTSYIALLLNVPEHRDSGRYQTAQTGAIDGRLGELAPRNCRRLIVHDALNLARDFLAIVFGRRLGEGFHQRRDARVALPAGEVGAIEGDHDVGQRRAQIEAAGVNAIDAPALLLGATRQHAGPVHHLEVDVEPDKLQPL